MQTTYYGKRYRSVFVSTSRSRANVVAHGLLFNLKEEKDVKEKQVILVEHHGTRHYVFVKEPFDKMIKQVR